MTIRELKAILKHWPEEHENGEPTEVWLQTGDLESSPCTDHHQLNRRYGSADLLLCFDGEDTE